MQQGFGVLQFLAALIVGALGFVGGIWAQSLKSEDTSKEIVTRTVTNERAQWRTDLRNVAGELVETAWRLIEGDSAQFAKLDRYRVLIKLRLNPNEKHELDQKIIKAANDITKHAKLGNQDAFKAAVAVFEDSLQKLLKQEWDKSKQEARTGHLSSSQ